MSWRARLTTIALAALATSQVLLAQSSAIKLATVVMCLPQYHPAVSAGQAAMFDHLANGRFIMGVGPGGLLSDFELFGVLDKDRIRLQVSPEFSAINSRNSVNGIPGLDTRAADTTVDLREGQWLAIAGLLQNEQTGTSGRIPFVGDIPVIRTFFSNKTVSRGETELIVLVSPELVHPIEPEDFPCLLPGMDITEPTDWQFYIQGHLEGDPECHHRSTVWPQYADQIHMVHKGRLATESFYVSGPHGFSEILYAFTSMGNNNGSAFAGIGANVPFYNLAGAAAMFVSRTWIIVPVLAMAGALARKKAIPVGPGTLPTHRPLFIGFLVCVVIIVGALTFVPALALGPVAEHLALWGRP